MELICDKCSKIFLATGKDIDEQIILKEIIILNLKKNVFH